MKEIMAEFAALEPVNADEERIIADLERDMRKGPSSWEYLCGVAEGTNTIIRMYPFSTKDVVFKCVVRVVIIVAARLALEAIQEEEDLESFPEEL